MSEFIEFSLPEHSLNEDTTKKQDLFCILCLRKKIQFINLTTCQHANVLDSLLEMKMLQLGHFICMWCHNMLRKINKFKVQALESFNVLNSGFQHTIQNYPPNLEYSKIELQSTINSQPIEFQTVEHTFQNETFEFGTEIEIKVEQTDGSDFENDIPFVEISKNPQSNATDKSLPQIKKKSNKKAGKSPLQSKEKMQSKTQIKKTKELQPRTKICDGKVKIIVLSEQEMLEDRKLDASNSRYLKLPYKCEKCITGFDHELILTEHMEKRHKKEKGSQVCNICESVLNTKLSFEEHSKRHYRRYECMECGKRNHNVYSVLKHYNETHGKVDMSFTCNLCDFTTESHRSYRYHRDKHRTSSVACEQCGKTFVTKAGLRVHMLTVHRQSDRIYSCEPCGKVYRTKSGLSAHMAITHAAVEPAYCVACDLTFRSEFRLRHHLKTASKHVTEDYKRFTCNDCDAKFLTKKQLREHIDWVHLNCTNHICNQCSKSFKNERGLKRHLMFVHEKIRPPRNKICDHCGRGFTSWTILRSHIRTHTGERPLRCAHCAATFAHSAALYTHRLKCANRSPHKKLLHNNRDSIN